MGIESYFINVVFKGAKQVKQAGRNEFIGSTNLVINDVEFYIKGKGAKEIGIHKYLFDDSIIIELIRENNSVLAITLQGCLSWYPQGLNTMVSFAKSLNNELSPIHFNYPALKDYYPIKDSNVFIEEIMSIYSEKYDNLKKQNNHIMNTKLPPGKEFYRYKDKSNNVIFKMLKKYLNDISFTLYISIFPR